MIVDRKTFLVTWNNGSLEKDEYITTVGVRVRELYGLEKSYEASLTWYDDGGEHVLTRPLDIRKSVSAQLLKTIRLSVIGLRRGKGFRITGA